jgi:hypothetical protein
MSARHSYLLASVATAGLVLSPNAAVGGRAPASLAAADVVAGLSVSSSGPGEFAGDRPLLATISPNGDGFRDAAVMQITLRRAARVRLSVTPTGRRPRQPVFTRDYRLAPGSHRLVWAPPASIPARTYLMLLDVAAGGHTWHFGARDLAAARTGVRATAVVRVQGVDAYFAQQSYAPGTPGTLVVATDAEQVAVTMHRIGPERIGLDSPNTLSGPQVGTTVNLAWSRFRSKPHRVRVWVGSWPSGLYYAELQTSDGRIGYAPFVVRPATLGDKTRVAIVLPTNTCRPTTSMTRTETATGTRGMPAGATTP